MWAHKEKRLQRREMKAAATDIHHLRQAATTAGSGHGSRKWTWQQEVSRRLIREAFSFPGNDDQRHRSVYVFVSANSD